MNACDHCGTPKADLELQEFRHRFGRVPQSAFLYHYSRLIEIVFALERIAIEAPRGTLIHHYKVDGEGAITWANLIVATGHNNLALRKSVNQVAKHYIDGNKLNERMLNHVSAVVRAYDPCLSCSTHTFGVPALKIRLVDTHGAILEELAAD